MVKRMDKQEEDEIMPEQVIIIMNQDYKKLYQGTLRELCQGYMDAGFIGDHVELIYTINSKEAITAPVDGRGVWLYADN